MVRLNIILTVSALQTAALSLKGDLRRLTQAVFDPPVQGSPIRGGLCLREVKGARPDPVLCHTLRR